MQMKDVKVLGAFALLIAAFLLTPGALDKFIELTGAYPFLMGFVKFALLATFGECLALRLTSGGYNKPGFGILAHAVVWGFLGIGIGAAFTVFGGGVPLLLQQIGLPTGGTDFGTRLLQAFSTSFCINVIFAPVFMTFHKITDLHIADHGGKVSCLLKPIPMGKNLGRINWNVMWGFVFKKTLPLFWIPAHTLTFMLPGHFRVLFAAALGVVLGIILAFAASKK